MPEKKINKNLLVSVTKATITDNINSNYLRIIDDKEGVGGDLAEYLQELALDAIEKGLGTEEWEKYMKNFASNQSQLDRLMGKDAVFNKGWKKTLSYLVANSTCGINTDTLTGKNLNTDALRALDADINDVVEAGFEKDKIEQTHTNSPYI